MHELIPVGISSCLVGERVRFDGGHKQNRYIMDTLGKYFDFRTFCPEMAIGLGVPRQTIRLIKEDDRVQAHFFCLGLHVIGFSANGFRHGNGLVEMLDGNFILLVVEFFNTCIEFRTGTHCSPLGVAIR